MRPRGWIQLLTTGLLGLLLGACAWEQAQPRSTTVRAVPDMSRSTPDAPAADRISCFKDLHIAPDAPAGAPTTVAQAEARARASRGPRAGDMKELLTARLITVTASENEQLRGRTAWLLTFALATPPGQPATPPPGLAWRIAVLIDAETGGYAGTCSGLLPDGEGRP